jgi:heat-inducible transcriptional repressor
MKEYDFAVSSATIRNTMGKLEKAGFLYQPHASAGRIPSDSGYRIYVDKLITPDDNIKLKIEELLTKESSFSGWSYEALLTRAAQILANLSGCIALITLPKFAENILHHLQLIRIANKQIMLILVIDSYQTESVLLEAGDLFEFSKDQELELIDRELAILSNFLNSNLKGKSLKEIYKLDGKELAKEFKTYTNFINLLLQEINRHYNLSNSTPIPIMIRGISEFIRQPEFSQMNQVHNLLYLLEEEQQKLLSLIFDFTSSHYSSQSYPASKVKVSIGSEIPLEPMHPCSVISSTYHQGADAVGSVGVIGPTRMMYENAIALVESTAEYLSETLS